jgi:hypothetical protein
MQLGLEVEGEEVVLVRRDVGLMRGKRGKMEGRTNGNIAGLEMIVGS